VTGQADFSLIVGYGTDMGNAEDAAMSFAEAVADLGISAEAIELNQIELAELQSATHFVVVTSTFGDGEFPDNALLFWEAISTETDRFEHLNFAVLALGDTSYEFFCNAGKLLDERLEALGATRPLDRVDIDGHYEQQAAAWTTDVVKMLAELGVGPDHAVADHADPLGVLLTRDLEIRTPSRALQALVASRTNDAQAAAALGADHVIAEPGAWAYGKDVLDLIRLADLTVDEVLDSLRPLQFRDYSIASSPLVHPDRVHLTVANVRYHVGDRRHGGVASTFLADRGEAVRVHLRPNHTFRLPAPNVPIIMIGPGTGIAPFRGFLQERQASGASGPSWLFFGDRRRATDFLYGDELEGFVQSGTLARLDLAFSRDGTDGDPKVYVQQRMWENSTQLFGWLQDGAHLYVCGDAERMAKDADAALHDIVARCGGMDAAAAHAYVNDLIKSHRYVRDVY
jgi:sulfite reductase (NADPH) flavoprotein alpha-component